MDWLSLEVAVERVCVDASKLPESWQRQLARIGVHSVKDLLAARFHSCLSGKNAAAVEDARKIGMAKAAALSHDRFTTCIELDPDLRAAVDWIAARDPIQEGVLVSHLVH